MDLSVNKGGVCWAEFSLGRGPKGMEVSVRTIPQVEDFIRSLCSGKKDDVELYGREWYPISTSNLSIYRMDVKEISGRGWILNKIAEPLSDSRDERVNLSFLRIEGISRPEGIRFGIRGPYSRDFIKEFGKNVTDETRNLILQYIVPVHINFRISTNDV